MAFYKHLALLTCQAGDEFDELHDPGDLVPLSGVYGCQVCGRSIVVRRAEVFPTGDDHIHGEGEPALWRLIVRSHSA